MPGATRPSRGNCRALHALALALACVATAACGAPAGSPSDAARDGAVADTDAGVDDPDPVITPDQRAALSALHYNAAATAPADPSNRFADDPRARTFGQRLFFDRSFSGPLLEGDNDGSVATLGNRGEAGKVSCAGCHLPEGGFVDTRSPHRQISLAAQWTVRRTPTVLEVGWAPLYNWDGRRDTLWNQALGVIESDREFNSSRLFVAEQVWNHHRAEYEAIFGALPPLGDTARFPALAPTETGCRLVMGVAAQCHGKPGDNAEYDHLAPADQDAVTRVAVNVSKALAAYLRLLRCGSGRFDRWLDGDATALTRAEQRGAALFVGRAGCATCHGGPQLTDGAFHNVGLIPQVVAVAFTDTNDRGARTGLADALADPLNARGRYSDGDRGVLPAVVGPEMEGAFRTPTLRCVATHPSFMHTGHMGTLERVVAFFNRGGDPPGGGYPGTNELVPLGLSERERADLVAFLGTLEGSGPDAALTRPMP